MPSARAGGGPRIPRVSVAAQGEQRRAGFIFYGESEPTPEGGCSGFIADGFGVVRKPVPVREGRVTARLYVRWEDRPDLVRVKMWRRVDAKGFPEGRGRAIRFDLRREAGRWVVSIHPFVTRMTYGELYLKWLDNDGCGSEEGLWLFLLDPRRVVTSVSIPYPQRAADRRGGSVIPLARRKRGGVPAEAERALARF
jgi:hypothetical protein